MSGTTVCFVWVYTRKHSSPYDWNEGEKNEKRKEEEQDEKRKKIDAFAYCRASLRVYIYAQIHTHA